MREKIINGELCFYYFAEKKGSTVCSYVGIFHEFAKFRENKFNVKMKVFKIEINISNIPICYYLTKCVYLNARKLLLYQFANKTRKMGLWYVLMLF